MSVKLCQSNCKTKVASKLTKTCLLVCLGCFIFFLIGIGSGLYSATVLNKPTPTPIAVERFHHLYKVEGKLEDEIREKVVPKVKDIADDTVQIVNEMVHRLVRSERSINSSPPKNKKYWKKTLKKLARPKRELSSHFTPENLDPIQHTEKEAPIVVEDKLVREKRRALEDLRQEFFRCKQFTGNDCGEIYREMSKLSQEIDERFARMRSIVRELNPDEGKVPENPKPLYSKMDYDKMKEEKRRMKQLQGHESIDCSSEEINGKGCARKTFNIYENDTNIVHVKTKTYTKPSTIGISSTTQAILSSRTSTEQSSTVTTSKVESTSINVTPAFPEDPKENEFRARSVFKAPPRPMYRDHYGNQMGYAPPPNENLDHHLSHELMYKQKPYGLQQETRFHHRFMNNKRLEDFVENPAIVQVDPISVTTKRPEMKRTTKTTTTTTTEDPVQSKIMGAHGTLLSVCEQFARDNAKNVKTDANGNILSANGNFQARPVSSVGQQLPQTGQSSKASAQVFVNPGFNQMGVPLCFMSQFNPTPLNQWYANYYGQSGPQAMSRGFPQNQFIQPTPFPFPGNYPNNNYGRNLVMAPSAPSQGNYYCAFMPQANQQIPGGFGTFRTSENMGLDGNQQIPTVTEHTNVPSETDIIYASFTNKPVKNVTEIVARASVSCPPGTMACAGSGECIEISKWCDSRINCMDASDEVACSCKARLPAIRICDGVIDCPLGDDELGCNGCDKFSFTCYNSQDEFRAAHGSTTSMCYTVNDRCDGIRNCMNGKDEKDCNIIVKNIGGYLSHEVSYTDGFLYRNFKGKWYPVCKNPENWAKMACDAEVGHSSENPRIVNQPNPNVLGHFVSNKGGSLQDPDVHEHCDAPTYVSCPQIKCGRVKNPHEPSKKKRQTPSPLKFDNETVSIVGGTDCHPHEWPFVVSIFKNGRHHCGGAIKSQQWIITAAHCFHSYHKHYYEVKAGALRHRSYNPEVQFSPIIKVFVYPEYNQKAMIEDLALVKIATPLNYNRYVRPICMPAPGRSGHESDWKMGPPAHQICSVIGWGTIAENGPHPDGLKQVKFPILPTCKNNNNGKAICAGELAGGRDACQGDSGGPLLCNSLSDSSEWYLAGVVSHGEGCAREGRAGIYTRISLYLDWLDQTEAHDGDPGTYPITACNGFKCIWGGGKCLPRKSRCNGIVECLGGEDEVDCQFSAHQLRTIENNRFRADDDEATTTTQAARTTIIDSTSKASTEIPLSTEPETTIIVSSSTTTETSSTSESTTTESTTEMKTEPETTIKTMEETTTTTPEPSTSPSTTESTTISSTTTTEPTPTSQSTVTTRTTSRDGRQISFESTLSPISTNSPVMESPQNATIDTGRFLFPLRSTTTLAPETTTTLTTVPSTSGFVPIPIESSTMKPLINSLTADPVKNDKFLCKNIPQKINPIHRCDRQTDCEDGTDEFNCTCKEFLVHQEPQKICDGFVDCVDLTDEEGCLTCEPDQFKCRLSKTCISATSRCDNTFDCEYKEDELDCVTLTNGTTVLVTPDYNPVLKNKGYVTHNHKGKWTIHCDPNLENSTQSQLAGQICISLGFAGYEEFRILTIGELTDLEVKIVNDTTADTRRTIAQERVSLVNMKENMVDIESVAASSSCVALWIECVPHTSSNKTHVISHSTANYPLTDSYENRPVVEPNEIPHVILPVEEIDERKINSSIGLSEYQWPFSAVVFAEGKPICNGILVARQWVMIEATCMKLHKLELDYIAVLLGSSNSFLHIQGPYEIVTRVDCIREIPNANVVLLHLDYPVYYNRYVLPTYLIETTDREVETSECLTVSIDKFGRLRSWPVEKTPDKCPTGYKCFKQNSINGTSSLCEMKDYIWRPGYVLCRTESSSWFPTGFYHDLHGICSQDNILTVLSLTPKHFHLLNVIESLECYQNYGAPLCYGHRCPFGVCLPEKHVCDGVVHCHDSSDEAEELCHGRKKRVCNHDEIKCSNGHCVEKSKFCDQINDCGDYTDEPRQCSCLEYLKITDPDKICDGIRNCFDKSDENNEMCRCDVNRFRCGNTLKCIPYDFVCDSDVDCPGGEDEQYCYGLQNNNYHDGYFEVMQQELGLWHTKCFPKSKPPTETDLIEICKKLGYINPMNPKARTRVDSETVMAILPSGTSSNSTTKTIAMDFSIKDDKKLNPDQLTPPPPPSSQVPATKAIIHNSFSELKVNKNIKLYIKPSRPLAQLANWDENDEKHCLRIEIKCD